ncbi:MAG: hypothetical protein AAGA02_10620, partial [Bacteroidota bacterium]
SRASKYGNKVTGFVAPHFVSRESPLYHVENEYNAALIEGEFANEQVLIGKGAGKLPTGLAVLSDVAAITRGYHYDYPNKSDEYTFITSEEEVYVSFEKGEVIDFGLFNTISEKYIGQKSGYVIGEIKLDKLKQLIAEKNVNAIFTSGAEEEIEVYRLSYSYA